MKEENSNFYSELKELMLQVDPESIYYDEYDGLWTVTTDWLVGAFAGCAFVDEESNSIENCLEQMHKYFLENINHDDSFVGFSVTRSGYPDLAKVRSCLIKEDKDEV